MNAEEAAGSTCCNGEVTVSAWQRGFHHGLAFGVLFAFAGAAVGAAAMWCWLVTH